MLRKKGKLTIDESSLFKHKQQQQVRQKLQFLFGGGGQLYAMWSMKIEDLQSWVGGVLPCRNHCRPQQQSWNSIPLWAMLQQERRFLWLIEAEMKVARSIHCPSLVYCVRVVLLGIPFFPNENSKGKEKAKEKGTMQNFCFVFLVLCLEIKMLLKYSEMLINIVNNKQSWEFCIWKEFCVGYLLSTHMASSLGAPRQAALLVGGYLVAVNVGAAGLFWYDKQKAIRHEWRVRESTLQLSALAGGDFHPPPQNLN